MTHLQLPNSKLAVNFNAKTIELYLHILQQTMQLKLVKNNK